jgi:hypothetical protein
VLKDVKVRFGGREVTCTALFDTGSGFTVISRSFFERSFGDLWSPLPRLVKLHLADDRFVKADKYVEVTIVIDDIELLPPETALVLEGFAEEEGEDAGHDNRIWYNGQVRDSTGPKGGCKGPRCKPTPITLSLR